jgi:16S rRNA G527 N7-methylase RsmG
MKKIFNSFGIELNDEQENLFEKYYELLLFYNSKLSLAEYA